MIYLQLFWSFFQIGIFAIGGGYAAMPLIQHQTMELHQWLTMQEFTDLITIAEMTPGPIAINSATFVGTRDRRYRRRGDGYVRFHRPFLFDGVFVGGALLPLP